jgi:hypothetical protein
MKTLISILFFYFSIIQPIFSQYKVRGIVRDYEFGDNVSNVSVFVDTLGYYKLNKNEWKTYARGNPKELKTVTSDEKGSFQVDSIFQKRINLILNVGKFYPFVIENIDFDKPEIDLGEVLIFRGYYLESDKYYTMFYRYMGGNKEIQLPYPIYGMRKKIKISGIYVIMDYKELMRKK